ncbi:hypothetical protein BJ878DRAFT_81808 [Calycina marina]|uniref:Uncharacterized protein n=1 Tax=Calycina marina TaxID=1763456 RepID=A0A9P7Z2J3_9HELO|nr:hypothetical protein BJ878DRAFT_81808 [Calycina marina]
MHFSIFTTALVSALPFITASPLARRDAPTVLAGITKISYDIGNLTTLVAAYTGAATDNILPLIIAVFGLKIDVTAVTNDTTASPTFTSAESCFIADALTDLAPFTISLLTGIQAKAAEISTGRITPVVEDALTGFLDDVNAMFTAITNAVVLASVAAVDPSQQQIAAAFTSAIATFNTTP